MRSPHRPHDAGWTADRNFEAWNRAARLIERGAKVTVIAVATGLTQWQIRRIWTRYNSDLPPRGQIRNLQRLCNHRSRHLDMSAFIGLYRKLSRCDVSRVADFDGWLLAYDLYCEMADELGFDPRMRLSINECWQLVVGLYAGYDLIQRRCECGLVYAYMPRVKPVPCPLCGAREVASQSRKRTISPPRTPTPSITLPLAHTAASHTALTYTKDALPMEWGKAAVKQAQEYGRRVAWGHTVEEIAVAERRTPDEIEEALALLELPENVLRRIDTPKRQTSNQ